MIESITSRKKKLWQNVGRGDILKREDGIDNYPYMRDLYTREYWNRDAEESKAAMGIKHKRQNYIV